MVFTSLYIHIPFCIHRCGYCDFNTYAGIQEMIPTYSQAVCEEIEYLYQTASQHLPIHTIYFGGGTPSLVPDPGTVSENYLKNVHGLGINRISFGMQSAIQHELTLLERQHSYEDVVRAIEGSRNAGISNLNLDLIFGLPGQEMNSWLISLEAALSLHPEHLSLYALTLEHGTPMQHKVESGALAEPDPDTAADMYEAASEMLSTAGFVQYEISNWARVNESGELYSCKHNLQYWRNLPYLGVGAGAHGFMDHYRTVDVSTPGAYIRRMGNKPELARVSHKFPYTPATIHMNPIDKDTEIGETMMMGLRLVMEGVSGREFQLRFGMSLQQRFGEQIDRLIALDLLEWNREKNDRLRLTPRGRLLGNQVFKEFI
jgi:oxygen-independent coproporphyrinogen-3 oxidase